MEKALQGMELEVYEIIKEYSEQGKWVSMNMLASLTNCGERAIRKYVNNIREYEGNEKIIIGCEKGYKILDKEEELVYLSSKKKTILNSLRRYYKDIRRFNNNKNYKLDISEEDLKIVKTF